MLATIVLDAYEQSETEEIANALSEICSADQSSGWSSAGIYCYWNYYTKEILYFGLAVDLFERFKQHNGLISTNSRTGNKYNKIQEYFKTNQKLGFSIFLQSSLSQPFTSKLKNEYRDIWELNKEEIESIGKDGRQSVQFMEGVLIKCFQNKTGNLPSWNKIGGSILGQLQATSEDEVLMSLFTNENPNGNVSRATIRELAINSEYNLYESQLHAYRISGMPESTFMRLNTEFSAVWKELNNKNYLDKPYLS